MSAAFDIPVLQRISLAPMRWFAVLIGLSVPISVALDNILLAFVLLGALCSLGSIARISASHPVARAALLLFAVLTMAMFYGAAPLKEAFSILGKYADLLFVPVFMFIFAEERVRKKARYAFLAAMAVTLFVSLLVGAKILPPMSWMNIFVNPGNPVIFHSHITQNNMMAFAIFLALLEWRDTATPVKRIAWGVFILLGAINVLFMVQGRTGYLILLALLGWFAWGWKQGGLILCALALLAFAAYHTSTRLP